MHLKMKEYFHVYTVYTFMYKHIRVHTYTCMPLKIKVHFDRITPGGDPMGNMYVYTYTCTHVHVYASERVCI